MNLITHQTGEEGKKVERLYLEGGVDIKSEFYAAITLTEVKRWMFLWFLQKVELRLKK